MTGEDSDWTQWVNRVSDDPSSWAEASDQLTQQFLKVGDLRADYVDYISVLMELTSITPLLLVVERGVDLVPSQYLNGLFDIKTLPLESLRIP